jgi:hypothetical protein
MMSEEDIIFEGLTDEEIQRQIDEELEDARHREQLIDDVIDNEIDYQKEGGTDEPN